MVWAWSEELNTFIQNVNKQYDNNINTLMNKFTDGKTLHARITPPFLVTEKYQVVSSKVYTELLTKKQKRIK